LTSLKDIRGLGLSLGQVLELSHKIGCFSIKFKLANEMKDIDSLLDRQLMKPLKQNFLLGPSMLQSPQYFYILKIIIYFCSVNEVIEIVIGL
jgi:hypothetical protein